MKTVSDTHLLSAKKKQLGVELHFNDVTVGGVKVHLGKLF